jgi:ribosomal protein S18 acetylase RimI-like enzyme
MTLEIRRLGPGDGELVVKLATREPRTALLDDPRTLFLVALDGGAPVGFVLAYELPRRHGHAVTLCIYEVDVDAAWQRRGVATRLLRELEGIARRAGIAEAFVLTDPDNVAAMELYRSVGGVPQAVVEWDFDYAEDLA